MKPAIRSLCSSRLFALLLLVCVSTGCGIKTTPPKTYWQTLNQERPIIIAHRGDSGNYPEHTLLAYQSALELKADFIEPDVVLTKDGVPICRHDLSLMGTTNIAGPNSRANPEFYNATGITLARVKQLQAKQRKGRKDDMKLRLQVPTLAEAIELVDRHNVLNEEQTGLYIEIKQPDAHRAAGLDISKAVLDVLAEFEQAGSKPNVVLQCFDRAETERLAKLTDYPVVWLSSKKVNLNDLPKGIAGLGLNKKLIEVIEDDTLMSGMRSPLIDEIHAKGLMVHVWTYRDDQLPGTKYDDGQEEIEEVLRAGADGVFTDFPETGVDAWRAVIDDWRIPLLSQRSRTNK